MTEKAEPTTVSDPDEYLAAAEKFILELPVQTEFINAHVHNAMRANGWPELSEPRRFGPMLLRLRKEGFIEKVGSPVHSTAFTRRYDLGVATYSQGSAVIRVR